jgi:hypothetical protein
MMLELETQSAFKIGKTVTAVSFLNLATRALKS